MSIHELRDRRALSDDSDLVPVPALHERLQDVGVAHRLQRRHLPAVGDAHGLASPGEKPAPPLFIDVARICVGRVDVRLIALHDPAPRVRQQRAPELDAAVAGGVARAHSVLERQLEVPRPAAPPDNERVRLERLLRRGFADDRPMLHPPECGVAVPAGERGAVKDLLRRGGGGSRERAQPRREQRDQGVSVRDHGCNAAIKPCALSKVSRYSCSGSESATMPPPTWKYTSRPSTRQVRITKLVSSAPESERYPMVPQYAARWVGSSSAMICIARTLGAPVIEPPGNAARNRSTASCSGASSPTTVETRWWTVA